MDSVQDLFLEALALPVEQRQAFLNGKQLEPDTKASVERLLAATEGAEDYCDRLARRISHAQIASLDDSIPERVGPYRPKELIGRGGMGAVYLAERADDQYEKLVAIKILPSASARQDSVERFLRERQILAKLVHPHICRLLDGGLTDDGRPYFVMDYVVGNPIDHYCDARRLSIDARLKLFCTVCEAVHHAHANLILHRDLKPGNILVDEKGAPQLLDFGVSALLQEDQAPETEDGHQPLTPSYVSPETLRGESPTTASDVYSLGVVLYRLLTGRRAYDFQSKPLEQILAEIKSSEPKPASRRVLDEDQHIEQAIKTTPPTSRATLSRTLAGDLDAILSKALRNDPKQRYPSVTELVADIEAYLDVRPVGAVTPTFGYRFGKFFRRYRVRVSLGALAIVLIIALAGLALQFAITTARQAQAVAAERDRAENVSDFLLNLFKQANPRNNPKGSSITAKELVAIGVERLEKLHQESETQNALISLAATAYGHMNEFADSKALLVELLEREQAKGNESSVAVADLLDRISTLEDALGDWEASEQRALESIEIREKTGNTLGMASTLNRIGRMRHVKGDYPDARGYYERALQLYQSAFEGDHSQVAQTISHLASLALHQERLDDAERMHKQALAMRARLYGEQHLSRIESLLGLGQVLHKKGDLDEAGALLEQAIAINDHFLGPGSRNNGYVFNTLGQVKQSAKAYDEAAIIFERALAIWRGVGDGRHPVLGTVLGNLGKLHMEMGDAAAAEPLLEESLSIVTRARPDHWQTAELKLVYGQCLWQRGDQARAEPLIQAGRDGLVQHWGDSHEKVLAATASLEALYSAWPRAGSQ